MVSVRKPVSRRNRLRVILFSVLAFTVLAIRFSPNWWAFYNGVRDAKLNAATPAQRAAIDETVLTGYSARGFYVTQQAGSGDQESRRLGEALRILSTDIFRSE